MISFAEQLLISVKRKMRGADLGFEESLGDLPAQPGVTADIAGHVSSARSQARLRRVRKHFPGVEHPEWVERDLQFALQRNEVFRLLE